MKIDILPGGGIYSRFLFIGELASCTYRSSDTCRDDRVRECLGASCSNEIKYVLLASYRNLRTFIGRSGIRCEKKLIPHTRKWEKRTTEIENTANNWRVFVCWCVCVCVCAVYFS
jgi:hypothetical protein